MLLYEQTPQNLIQHYNKRLLIKHTCMKSLRISKNSNFQIYLIECAIIYQSGTYISSLYSMATPKYPLSGGPEYTNLITLSPLLYTCET